MSEQETYKQKYYNLLRKTSLVNAGIPIEKTDQYVKYIDGQDEEAITQQAQEVAEQAQEKPKSYVDPAQRSHGVWNPFK